MPLWATGIERRHLAKYGVEPGEVLGRLRDFGYQPHRPLREGRVPVTHVTDDCRNYLFTA
ncbi:hypothetical protein ACFZDI_31320 [Streptomyces sp. NPDC007907]|uniref:hypothetical protein n=1 Tax=Streptomyces sp. NPDC007907 TaxID=3364789 RepID=UPI0036E7BF5C